MEGTVTIKIKDYNELVDFKKNVMAENVIKYYGRNPFLYRDYITKDETIKELVDECNELNDIYNTIKKDNIENTKTIEQLTQELNKFKPHNKQKKSLIEKIKLYF